MLLKNNQVGKSLFSRQLIDEQPLWHLIPPSVAPENDLGIIKKLVNIVSPHDGVRAVWYAQPYNQVLEFKPSYDNAENHNDSFIKLKFTVAGLSADAKMHFLMVLYLFLVLVY